MADKVNLNKLKEEIDIRKREKQTVSTSLGEGVNIGKPNDEFLHGLLEARKTGRDTPSTEIVKTVINKAVEKKGGTPVTATQSLNITPPNTGVPARTVEMSPERDEQMFTDLKNSNKQTLADSIQGFTGANVNPAAGVNAGAGLINYGGMPLLTEKPHPQNQTVQINEEVLINSVGEIVNAHLVENLTPILEKAIESTIIEMYAAERINEVLQKEETKELIKAVVYDTIRELKSKK